MILDTSLLIIGLVFTLFVPGFLVIESFFDYLPKIQKIPLYFFLSILFSTYLVYFVSYLVGYSRLSIIFSFLLFAPLVPVVLWRRRETKPFLGDKKYYKAIILSIILFFLFMISLYPAIFFKRGDYYVMGAVNWQDTAMHLGIIESIAQGNFPPQAPYYAGQPLTYYYFVDFHSAVINTLYNHFFPRILVLINPFLVLIFSLSVYALAYSFTHKKSVSLMSMVMVVLGGNLMFIRFFQDLNKLIILGRLNGSSILDLLASGGYTMEYKGLFQMVPMADYFLQNRPMMIGLSGVVLISLLLHSAYQKGFGKNVFLAGLITGMLIKFQFFSFVISIFIFFLFFLINLGRKNLKWYINTFLLFIIPVVIFVLLFRISAGGRFVIDLVRENFHFMLLDRKKSFLWYLNFFLMNLGPNFFISLFISPYIYFLRKNLRKGFLFLYLWLFTMFVVPLVFRFTIYEGDMFKFYYFMLIPQTILTSYILVEFWKRNWLSKSIVVVLFFISISTSLLTLSWSFLNKSKGYSQADYKVGMWIRRNTPKRSVFMGMPTVHCPITQIGGRLRILSYINWPYSHGFNTGEDNVFKRLRDIKKVYERNTRNEERMSILYKYETAYIFYGREERRKFPNTEELFDNLKYFETVYNSGGIKLYEVRKDLEK